MRDALIHAAGQAWPPFVLVTGLLMIGEVVEADGLFAALGTRIERIGGGPVVLLAEVGNGPWVKSGPKLKVACEELNVFRMNVIPVKPKEKSWEFQCFVRSMEYVRASRGVAFNTPDPFRGRVETDEGFKRRVAALQVVCQDGS